MVSLEEIIRYFPTNIYNLLKMTFEQDKTKTS